MPGVKWGIFQFFEGGVILGRCLLRWHDRRQGYVLQ